MEGEISYLSKSAFAAKQGWSPSYVTKLKDQGRLVLSKDGKQVDVDATLMLLGHTGDPGKEGVRQHHATARIDQHVGSQIRANSPNEPDANGKADPKYWDAKARREDTLAELAQLELARQRGNLVVRQRVEAMSFAAGRMLRDTMLGALPTQLAPELASMTDPFEIEVKLRNALRQILLDMSKMTADDLDKAMEPAH
ncbi:MAG: terminase small subunit [Gallionella sp.]|nr:terminase small subunit [Gallionella sp.]